MGNARTVAVTGAAGFIGRSVCERLVADGSKVIGLDVSEAGASALSGTGADFITCDTTDADAAKRAISGCDAVVHTAAIVSDQGEMEDFIHVNVRGTRNVLDAASEGGAGKVVHISSVASWGYEFTSPPGDEDWTRRQGVPYVDTKAASDDMALRRGAAVVRPGDVYGPRSTPWSVRPLEALKAGRFILPGKGEGLMTPVYVDDLVDLVVRALDSEHSRGRAFTGFASEPVTAATFFDHYSRMLGMERTPTAPKLLATFAAAAMEFAAGVTGRQAPVSRTAIVFISRRAAYSTRLASDLLGWSQEIDLAEGMGRTEEWFREAGLLPAAVAA